MSKPLIPTLILASLLLTQTPLSAQQAASPSPTTDLPSSTLVVPTGTIVPLTLVDRIRHKSTRPGGTVRAKVAFPITVGDQIALPVGTLVEGVLNPPTKGKKSPSPSIHFTRLLFANGYTVSLDATNTAVLTLPQSTPAPIQQAALTTPKLHGPAPTPLYAPDPQNQPPTVTNPFAHAGPTTKELVAFTIGPVAFVGGILLLVHFVGPHGDYIMQDAGWQFQMTLQNPLTLNAASAAAAAATPQP